MNKPKFKIKPTQVLVLGFILLILFGAVLLHLPIASADGGYTPFIDCIFTSASAVCVTGLTVVTTASHWSLFGQFVILVLIQIGGLGFITLMTSVLLLTGKKITLKERVVIQESLNLSQKHGMVRFVKFICKFTLIAELLGAVALSLRFMLDYPPLTAARMGVFHSISAFCNAGFDIIGNDSLIPYSQDLAINIIIIMLVIMGGLGFPVWVELFQLFFGENKNKLSLLLRLKRISLHSKLVLATTAFLLSLGTIVTLIFEYNNPATIGSFPLPYKILASLFHSVVLRTAGFVTINYGGLSYATKFISILFMMIGGSPCGTAGGIKTISIAVILLAVISLIKDKDSIYAFKREISLKVLQKALTVTILMLTILIVGTTLLSVTEGSLPADFEFVDLLFEVGSALGTVGSTIGITPKLSFLGKLIIIICMFIGRLGPITIAISFMSKDNNKNKVHYPVEDVLVG